MARDTTVLVLGGGSTGTGIARDLARRGVDVTLLEQGNLTHGTTGRMHGLLHSGGRYAVSDRASAEECIAENRVLRDVAAHCVEDTGGLFVKQPADSEAYFEEKLAACRDCGIDAQVLSGREARDVEPYLARDVEKAIAVPDAAVDPFRLVVANAVDAREHGARVETHSEVVDVLVADDLASDGTATASPTGDGKSAGAPEDAGTVVGVEVEHAAGAGPRVHGARGERETITAEYVVNATGPWAGEVAALAGVDVAVRPSKGAMTVMNVRQVDTVVNRCRPKGDADIVVPHETTAILGTTDVAVDDPTAYAETRAEVDRLVDELAEVVPILADARSIRSFWGVRPLYEPPDVGSEDSTDVTRDFFVLDHADRDGLDGFLTVVGGKFTTYRAMAEAVSDRVCDALGVTAACSTAEESLPGSEDPGRLDAAMDDYGLRSPIARRSRDRLGSRADAVLDVDGPNPVVCECEAVTTAEVADAIDGCGSDLNAVRIRTRATMGNCQGGLCCHRVANVLATDYPEPTVRAAWSELLEERWRGHRHALWGEQLSQAALNHFLHATTMNLDHDPGGGGADGSRGGGSEAAGDPRRSVTIDYAAFDAGPGREHGRTDGDQRADRDAHRGTDGGA